VAPGQAAPDGFVNPLANNVTYVPFDPKTVIAGNPNQWFNPYMFTLGTLGFLGNGGRGMLRGPGLGTVDLSLVKDTAVRFLGEKGSVQFRAELFNLLNRANFGMPVGTAFSGSTADVGLWTEKAVGNAGQITTTSTTSRQIQLALKLIF
jgi:hypothetical protein